MDSLAVKYRPKAFSEVVGQSTTIRILERQIEVKQISNCYLFCGPSGCGKTTLARILATELNGGEGSPIEIDGASNNGVDNVKAIIQEAKERSLDSTYKVYIVDECHAITIQGWNAFLKCLEEPPAYTVFVFCTTDPQKVPDTIKNRVMTFALTRLRPDEIAGRLRAICASEGATGFEGSVDYISKDCGGGMRDAIADLEKVLRLGKGMSMESTLAVLGGYSYDELFSLTDSIVDGDLKKADEALSGIFGRGGDLRRFADRLLGFFLDLAGYCVFKDVKATRIPEAFKAKLDYTTGVEGSIKYFSWLVDKALALKAAVKDDYAADSTISAYVSQMARGV